MTGNGEAEQEDETSDFTSNLSDNEDRRRSTPIDIKAKENTVLLDEDGLKITYKGLDADFLGHTIRLKLLIENNTSEAKMIQIRDEAINGYMCDGSFSPEVNAGMKANDDIAFYDLPDEVGITSKDEIKNIVFAFDVFDPDHASDAKIYNPIRLFSFSWLTREHSFDIIKISNSCSLGDLAYVRTERCHNFIQQPVIQ